ncbi:MAG: hypothetical protein KGK34_10815 [Chloroflexota bacterium]|nr:hypothetical protein [Chloroflexota bacterium]
MSGPLETRLRRLEQQVRAFRDLHARELNESAERLAAIAKLQADELQLILDELDQLVADAGAAVASTDSSPRAPEAGTARSEGDPGAGSPKRAKWLAEQERASRMSRRGLLGRALPPRGEDR